MSLLPRLYFCLFLFWSKMGSLKIASFTLVPGQHRNNASPDRLTVFAEHRDQSLRQSVREDKLGANDKDLKGSFRQHRSDPAPRPR